MCILGQPEAIELEESEEEEEEEEEVEEERPLGDGIETPAPGGYQRYCLLILIYYYDRTLLCISQ